MNLKPEQIPDEVVEAALFCTPVNEYGEDMEMPIDAMGLGSIQQLPRAKLIMKAAIAAALPVLLGEPVAWTEKDGDEWVVYGANSEVGQHILHYQKDMHFIRIFPIFSFATPETPNER